MWKYANFALYISVFSCSSTIERLKMNLFDLPRTEEDAVAFLQEKGIVQSSRECRNCHKMKLYFGRDSFWKCNKCDKRVNLRVGNWLEDSRLLIVTIVRFIYGWAYEYTSGKWCERELDIDKNTAVDWNMYYREVCVDFLLRQPRTKIGGMLFYLTVFFSYGLDRGN